VSKHYFNSETIITLSSAINDCATIAENSVLTTETRPVQWIEVTEINAGRAKIHNKFLSFDKFYAEVIFSIGRVDSRTQRKLEKTLNALTTIGNECVLLAECMNTDVSDASFSSNLTYTMTMMEANERIDTYLGEYHEDTNTYDYNWDNISSLLKKNAKDLSETDYYILATVLSTMTTPDGEIDLENLQKFVNFGYINPNGISRYDYRTSFSYNKWCTSTNGHDEYSYIRNIATMSETFKNVVYTYETLIDNAVSNSEYSPELKILMDNIINYFPQIEWRRKLYDTLLYDENTDFANEGNYWEGYRKIINQRVVDEFNNDCVARISISLQNDGGNYYYDISSNAYNKGNVVLTVPGPVYGSSRKLIGKEEDGYSDVSIRLYTNCSRYETSDITELSAVAQSQLSNFYKSYNLAEKLTEDTLDFVVGLIPGGTVLTSAKNLVESTTAVAAANNALKTAKSVDVEKIVDIYNSKTAKKVKKVEKAVDKGLSYGSTVLGDIASAQAVKLNNQQVDNCIKAVSNCKDKLKGLSNMGIRFDSLVVEYDHVSYDSNHDISVDKGSNTPTDVMEADFILDRKLLAKQYCAIMYRTSYESVCSDDKFNQEVDQLYSQIQEYMKTGKITDGSLLQKYKSVWQ